MKCKALEAIVELEIQAVSNYISSINCILSLNMFLTGDMSRSLVMSKWKSHCSHLYVWFVRAHHGTGTCISSVIS